LPLCAVLFALLVANLAIAQQTMPGMKMDGMGSMDGMDEQPMPSTQPRGWAGEILQHSGSGTSAEPGSTPTSMAMGHKNSWMLMFHASVFLLDTQQTGQRGGDKFFSTSWFMPMAQRKLGPGELTVQGMFSLEPATVTGERYPMLFEQGETAYGQPIVDGQHPHNLVMGLGAYYDLPLGKKTLLSFYAAPVGDPAIGPTAYPHRASAAENPVATLGHHQEDSTHVAYDVATVGLTYGIARVEASGFHGREPDEHRWQMQQSAIDSWSTRLTLQPGRDWSGQYSYALIHSPEQLFPAENQQRMTASVTYNRPLARGNWASTALWGRTRDLAESSKENSYLLESTLRFARSNYVWTRIENAGRSNELLYSAGRLPANFAEMPLTHVQGYTVGYDRDVKIAQHIESAVGAQVTLYGVGKPLQAIYGTDPISLNVFVRLRVKGKHD
jgi:hypothetical protein